MPPHTASEERSLHAARRMGWPGVPPATLECGHAGPPGTHPVLLLGLQLPHALQEPGLGPAQVCGEACDGDDVGLQLRGRDVYVHLRGARTAPSARGASGRDAPTRPPLAARQP